MSTCARKTLPKRPNRDENLPGAACTGRGRGVLGATWWFKGQMRNRPEQGFDVDSWLDAGLRSALDPMLVEASMVPRARYASSGKAPSGFGARRRLLAGSASALLLMGGTAMAAAAASTGSVDPTVWGRHITEAVASCRSDLTAGQAGIGQCVSAIASNKGHQGDGTPRSDASGRAHRGSSGLGSSPPGHSGSAPGQAAKPPGQGGTPPGHNGTLPSHPHPHPHPTPPSRAPSPGHR
jgi:hypothetical protein